MSIVPVLPEAKPVVLFSPKRPLVLLPVDQKPDEVMFAVERKSPNFDAGVLLPPLKETTSGASAAWLRATGCVVVGTFPAHCVDSGACGETLSLSSFFRGRYAHDAFRREGRRRKVRENDGEIGGGGSMLGAICSQISNVLRTSGTCISPIVALIDERV